jgi:hypothetical protein
MHSYPFLFCETFRAHDVCVVASIGESIAAFGVIAHAEPAAFWTFYRIVFRMIPVQRPNKSPERNARWRLSVVRKDHWFIHIVSRAWLSFLR